MHKTTAAAAAAIVMVAAAKSCMGQFIKYIFGNGVNTMKESICMFHVFVRPCECVAGTFHACVNT